MCIRDRSSNSQPIYKMMTIILWALDNLFEMSFSRYKTVQFVIFNLWRSIRDVQFVTFNSWCSTRNLQYVTWMSNCYVSPWQCATDVECLATLWTDWMIFKLWTDTWNCYNDVVNYELSCQDTPWNYVCFMVGSVVRLMCL